MGLDVFLCFGSKEITGVIKHLFYSVLWEFHVEPWSVNASSDLQGEYSYHLVMTYYVPFHGFGGRHDCPV